LFAQSPDVGRDDREPEGRGNRDHTRLGGRGIWQNDHVGVLEHVRDLLIVDPPVDHSDARHAAGSGD
jgi:hypothetical protein